MNDYGSKGRDLLARVQGSMGIIAIFAGGNARGLWRGLERMKGGPERMREDDRGHPRTWEEWREED